jgi:hypothetical protein
MTRPVPLVLLLALAAAAAPAQEAARSSTGIVGSYVLASRTLADGTEVAPPAVQGVLTYTADGMRNFNVVWDNPDGTRTSISYLAAYTLEDDRYCEQPMLWIQQNLMDTPGLSTDAPEVKSTDCGAVTVTADGVSFPVPGEPVTLTFDAAGVTTVAEMGFVDHWERVES